MWLATVHGVAKSQTLLNNGCSFLGQDLSTALWWWGLQLCKNSDLSHLFTLIKKNTLMI